MALRKKTLIAGIGFIGCLLMLTGCFESAQVTQAKKIIVENLKDPDSVKYRNISKTDHATCGEFNAKNSYGAYVGYKKFLVLTSSPLQYMVEGDGTETWTKNLKEQKTEEIIKKLDIQIANLKASNAQFETTGVRIDSKTMKERNDHDFFIFEWQKYCPS